MPSLLFDRSYLIPLTCSFKTNFNLTNNCIISSLAELICTPLYSLIDVLLRKALALFDL